MFQHSATMRARFGQCNLCLQDSQLTWDHVPPYAAFNDRSVEVRNPLRTLVGKSDPDYRRLSQNGLKYRTLCASCNGQVVGQHDQALIGFMHAVDSRLQTPLVLPRSVTVSGKPHGIVRAVLGHLVAANADIGRTTFDEMARAVLLEDAPFPTGWTVLYWVYSSRKSVVIRDFVIRVATDGDAVGFCQLLKAYPLGFLVTTNPGLLKLRRLTRNSDCGVGEEEDLWVDLFPRVPEHWPETPTRGHFLATSAAAASAAVTREY